MGIYDRDYMRARRDESPNRPPTHQPLSPIWWVGIGVLVLWLGSYAYTHRDAISPRRAPSLPDTATPTAATPQVVPHRDPLPDDPTWSTVPRASVEIPHAAVGQLPRVVFKCVAGGAVTYSTSADCRGGRASAIATSPSSETATTFPQARDPYIAPHAQGTTTVTITRNQLTEEGARTQTVTATGNLSAAEGRRIRCSAIEQEIIGLDAAARQPQSPQARDMVKNSLERARSRQSALGCRTAFSDRD